MLESENSKKYIKLMNGIDAIKTLMQIILRILNLACVFADLTSNPCKQINDKASSGLGAESSSVLLNFNLNWKAGGVRKRLNFPNELL